MAVHFDNDVLGDINVNVVEVQSDQYDANCGPTCRAASGSIVPARAGAAARAADRRRRHQAGDHRPRKAPPRSKPGAARTGTSMACLFAIQMQSVIYNTKVFADNGIEVPKTADELPPRPRS